MGALVTGGSRGIGRAITTRLATDGAAIVFTYATRADAADDLVAEITASGGWARALRCDLAAPEQLDSVFAEADRAFSEAGARGLNILVANAGIKIVLRCDFPADVTFASRLMQVDQVVEAHIAGQPLREYIYEQH